METIQICVNEANLLATLGYAFTNKFTVVKELMQNARRAKASFVAVEYDPAAEMLIVRDDGEGVSDFQKLVTICESGWDEETAKSEKSFGMGFMKALYSARHCTVISRGKSVTLDTARALRREPIEVRELKPAYAAVGAIVVLEGIALQDLDTVMTELAIGFPIEVRYNGLTLSRPYARDIAGMSFERTDIGWVHLAGRCNGNASRTTILFLQGFAIADDEGWVQGDNVVHLDPAQFLARLPDREQFIDQQAVEHRVEDVLREMWRQIILEAKAALPAAELVERYFEAAQQWGLTECFNDVPVLPGRLFRRVSGYPYQEGYADMDYVQTLPDMVSRETIERGDIRLIELDPPDGENMMLWMLVKAKGWLVFRSIGLHPGHWIWRHVNFPEADDIEVHVNGETVRTRLEGKWICPHVSLCESFEICLGDERVTISDEALFCGKQELIIVPAGEWRGRGALQCSSFIDPKDDHFHDDLQQADSDALLVLIGRLRATNPVEAVQSMVKQLNLEKYSLLHGKTFRLTVGPASGQHAVELVA
jgi:hypothetical protein